MDKSAQYHPDDEIWELIKFYYPKFNNLDISRLLAQLDRIPEKGLKVILHEGSRIPYKGKRLHSTYLETAAKVYELTGEEGFNRWFSLVCKVSTINSFCLEGFFKSSTILIEQGDISLLEKWTNLGLTFVVKSGRVAISYFTCTAKVVLSADFEKFKKTIGIGNGFAAFDVKVAESYFEHLPDFEPLLTSKNFDCFDTIVKLILKIDTESSMELITNTKAVLSAIPSKRRQLILLSLKKIAEFDVFSALALFNNAPLAMANLTDSEFRSWVSIAINIAKENRTVAVPFLIASSKLLGSIEMDEFYGWSNKGIDLIPENPEAAKVFFETSFSNSEKLIVIPDKKKREYLLDTGVRIAILNWKNLDDYFENAPSMIKLVTGDRFKEWADIGGQISKQNTIIGSGYYRDSVKALENINPVHYDEIFRIANVLLEKNCLLVGMFFEVLSEAIKTMSPEELGLWANTGIEVYDKCNKVAVDYFENSPVLLKDLDVSELKEWALKGIDIFAENPQYGKLYFNLKSRKSTEYINQLSQGVTLKSVSKVLNYYAIGISGSNFRIRSKDILQTNSTLKSINPLISGNTIYLAPSVKLSSNFEDNFKFYKLCIVHEVAHQQFISKYQFEEILPLIEKYMPNSFKNEAFVYGLKNLGFESNEFKEQNEGVELSDVIVLIPDSFLIENIMEIVEDARVEYRITEIYRGLHHDFKRLRQLLLQKRSPPENKIEQYLETLLWLSTGHEPVFSVDKGLRDFIDKSWVLLEKNIFQPGSSTLDSFVTTLELYHYMNKEDLIEPEWNAFYNLEYRGTLVRKPISKKSKSIDYPENIEGVPDTPISETYENKTGKDTEEKFTEKEKLEKPLVENNWTVLGSYIYDEWDTRIDDYKSDWCIVKEIDPPVESNEFYKNSVNYYKNEISYVKRIFRKMKPETFRKLKRQSDGDEIDLGAFTDALIERKCGINPDDYLYIKRDKRERDVATLFLVDVSASTQKLLYDGKSILDVEKDALIIMTQALESIGDKYAVYAFSGNTRKDVEYYSVKGFGGHLSNDAECRISALKPMSNTRLGPAIRHTISKLEQVEANTKVVVLLSDGEPYDFGLSEEIYKGHLAEEDTRMAIQEGNSKGINFFCITVDKEAEDYLDNIFSDPGYIIIDDAQKIPERLPLIYKKITT